MPLADAAHMGPAPISRGVARLPHHQSQSQLEGHLSPHRRPPALSTAHKVRAGIVLGDSECTLTLQSVRQVGTGLVSGEQRLMEGAGLPAVQGLLISIM